VNSAKFSRPSIFPRYWHCSPDAEFRFAVLMDETVIATSFFDSFSSGATACLGQQEGGWPIFISGVVADK
jgi:hypothetical protein